MLCCFPDYCEVVLFMQMLECHHELGLFHIQFTTRCPHFRLRSLNSVETLPGFIYISEETSSEHARSASWGFAKMELRPGWVRRWVCSRKRDGGTEAENGSAAWVLRGNASGYSNTGARKSESWNETEFWSIRALGCSCRQTRAEGAPAPTPQTSLTFPGLWWDQPALRKVSGSGVFQRYPAASDN